MGPAEPVRMEGSPNLQNPAGGPLRESSPALHSDGAGATPDPTTASPSDPQRDGLDFGEDRGCRQDIRIPGNRGESRNAGRDARWRNWWSTRSPETPGLLGVPLSRDGAGPRGREG